MKVIALVDGETLQDPDTKVRLLVSPVNPEAEHVGVMTSPPPVSTTSATVSEVPELKFACDPSPYPYMLYSAVPQ
jgi:hypothetical protein